MKQKTKKKTQRMLKKYRAQNKDRNKAAFQAVSDIKAQQEHYDYITREVVQKAKELRAFWLQCRDTEEELNIKIAQIENNTSSELYNGMQKPIEKVRTEAMILQHDYKLLIMKINKHRDSLRGFGIEDENIQKMISDEFDFETYSKERNEKLENEKV